MAARLRWTRAYTPLGLEASSSRGVGAREAPSKKAGRSAELVSSSLVVLLLIVVVHTSLIIDVSPYSSLLSIFIRKKKKEHGAAAGWPRLR